MELLVVCLIPNMNIWALSELIVFFHVPFTHYVVVIEFLVLPRGSHLSDVVTKGLDHLVLIALYLVAVPLVEALGLVQEVLLDLLDELLFLLVTPPNLGWTHILLEDDRAPEITLLLVLTSITSDPNTPVEDRLVELTEKRGVLVINILLVLRTKDHWEVHFLVG